MYKSPDYSTHTTQHAGALALQSAKMGNPHRFRVGSVGVADYGEVTLTASLRPIRSDRSQMHDVGRRRMDDRSLR